MPSFKLLIPLVTIIVLLQAGALTLPFIYWRLQKTMQPARKILFGTFLLLTTLILHPLLLIILTTFTIAPTLLALRHNLFAKAGGAYTALSSQNTSLLGMSRDGGLPRSKGGWLVALLGGYVGWRVLGVGPLAVLMGLLVKHEVSGGWRVQGKGVGVSSRRTDVQVFR